MNWFNVLEIFIGIGGAMVVYEVYAEYRLRKATALYEKQIKEQEEKLKAALEQQYGGQRYITVDWTPDRGEIN